MISATQLNRFTCTALGLSLLTTAPQAMAQKQKQLTDEDILNPKKLIFNKVVTFADSFDNAPVGTIFVSKRAILGNPEIGVLGEEGSPRHKQACTDTQS